MDREELSFTVTQQGRISLYVKTTTLPGCPASRTIPGQAAAAAARLLHGGRVTRAWKHVSTLPGLQPMVVGIPCFNQQASVGISEADFPTVLTAFKGNGNLQRMGCAGERALAADHIAQGSASATWMARSL
jgi:hypothetical protein